MFILNSADETISQEKSELRGGVGSEGGRWFEEVMKLSSRCRCRGEVKGGGEQGAEKEDKPPATAADKLRGH